MIGFDAIIVGAGLAGLTAAYRLGCLAPHLGLALVERGRRLGGKILTERPDGFVVEGGADSFLSRKPAGLALCEELGLTGRLHGRDPRHAATFVKFQGALHPLPEGFSGLAPANLEALAESDLLSPAGRARLAQEPEQPPWPAQSDESLAAFFSRRLGREAFERLVEPLLAGIYAGDASQLSLLATFPHLRQLELEHGSLLAGLAAGREAGSGPAGQVVAWPPFLSLPGGMGELVAALLEKLEQVTILAGCPATAMQPRPTGYEMALADGRRVAARAIILATPAYVTARLLVGLDETLAAAHAAIPYASTALVTLAFVAADLPGPLDGYGYVIPQIEGSQALACTWSSSKWPGRAPAGHALLRLYLGRHGRPDVTACPDAELLALARAELRQPLEVTAAPVRHWIHRWPQAMPQYTLGHLDRLAQIEASLKRWSGLFLAGAAYHGVGLPDCIHAGEMAAAGAHEYLLGLPKVRSDSFSPSAN
ncbi:MAG: protoporphyrinogen oxidase [Candidatus Promineifilaceae bacterium]